MQRGNERVRMAISAFDGFHHVAYRALYARIVGTARRCLTRRIVQRVETFAHTPRVGASDSVHIGQRSDAFSSLGQRATDFIFNGTSGAH